MDNIRLAVAQILTWPYVHSDFYLSFLRLHLTLPDYHLVMERHGDIAAMRNRVMATSLAHGDTHILFLDCDMVFPPDTWPRLLALLDKGADLASGLGYRGYPPYDPIAWGLEGLLEPGKDYQWGDVIEAEAVGASCLLVDLKVIQDWPPPWFKSVEAPVAGEEGAVKVIGEDVWFCREARKRNARLLVDTGLEIPHIREWRVDRNLYLLWRELQKRKNKGGE